MTGLPSRALDVQLDLLRYYESDPGANYAGAVTVAMFAPGSGTIDTVADDIAFNLKSGASETAITAHQFGVLMHRRITGVATTYAVSSEIVDVLEAASKSIPDYALHQSDMPVNCGFIYLERPIVVHDRNGKALVVRTIAWHLAAMDESEPDAMDIVDKHDFPDAKEAGIVVLIWTEPMDERDHMHDSVNDDLDMMKKAFLAPPHQLWSMIGGAWMYGMIPDKERTDHELFRLLMTFFRFVDESWVDTRAINPERPLVRRAARANVQPTIKVVRLRRRAQQSNREPGDGPDWQHRWLVSGHWRNQWYPSIQQHRPKWIAEYIKGPEDKPLVVHDKVFHVNR